MSITDEIHRRALLFCVDNTQYALDLPAIEAAMTIGASIVTERGGPDPVPGEQIPDEVWHS